MKRPPSARNSSTPSGISLIEQNCEHQPPCFEGAGFFMGDAAVAPTMQIPNPVDKLGFYEQLAPHPSLPCVKGGAPQGRRDCRSTKWEFAYISGKSVTFFRTIPQSASLTAPFTQGGLWRVRRFKQLAKLNFELLRMSFRAIEARREIFAFRRHIRLNCCKDPSIPPCFTRDDSIFLTPRTQASL